MIKTINDQIKSDLVEPRKFFEDLSKMYLSKYLIEMLRTHYTEKERKKLNRDKKVSGSNVVDCEEDWPICLFNILKNNYYHKSPSFYLYREETILNNFKPDHFMKRSRKIKKDIIDRSSVRTSLGKEFHLPGDQIDQSILLEADIKYSEKQLLIERTKHICKYGNHPEVDKREIDKRRKQMLFKIEVNNKNIVAKGSNARNRRKNSVDKMSHLKFTPGKHSISADQRKPKDDLDIMISRYTSETDHFGIRRRTE